MLTVPCEEGGKKEQENGRKGKRRERKKDGMGQYAGKEEESVQEEKKYLACYQERKAFYEPCVLNAG